MPTKRMIELMGMRNILRQEGARPSTNRELLRTVGYVWNIDLGRWERTTGSPVLMAEAAQFSPLLNESDAFTLVRQIVPGWTVGNIAQQDDRTWFCELRKGYLTSYTNTASSSWQVGRRPHTLSEAMMEAMLSAMIEDLDVKELCFVCGQQDCADPMGTRVSNCPRRSPALMR